jgi:hypothetical protein
MNDSTTDFIKNMIATDDGSPSREGNDIVEIYDLDRGEVVEYLDNQNQDEKTSNNYIESNPNFGGETDELNLRESQSPYPTLPESESSNITQKFANESTIEVVINTK